MSEKPEVVCDEIKNIVRKIDENSTVRQTRRRAIFVPKYASSINSKDGIISKKSPKSTIFSPDGR